MSQTNKNSSVIISSLYQSRKTILELMKIQGYDITEYADFSINEVNSMYHNKQLDMLLEKEEEDKTTHRKNKMYIRYFDLIKPLRLPNVNEIVDDLFHMEEVLTRDDTLYIITNDDIYDTLINLLKHIWETDGIFIVIQNIKRLQYNIMKHELVPSHRILTEDELKEVKLKYKIEDNNQFPDISRFDAVAQAICVRPGQVCEIIRPSKTAIKTTYYRMCIS